MTVCDKHGNEDPPDPYDGRPDWTPADTAFESCFWSINADLVAMILAVILVVIFGWS